MIGFLPELYPDELIYSLFARYYAYSGYAAYIDAAHDIYSNCRTRPAPEFINSINECVKGYLLKRLTMEELIENHTMFPAYSRFIPLDRRKKAFDALVHTEGNYNNYLYIPVRGIRNKYLRWCPICAKEDRENYGETYWHRCHQIDGVDICYKHYCLLFNSSVCKEKTSPMLISAEYEVPQEAEIYPCKDDLIISLTDYIVHVFNRPNDLKCDYNTGLILADRLDTKKYHYDSSWMRKNEEIYEDYCSFYRDMPDSLMNIDTMKKIFGGGIASMKYFCQLALFEDVSEEELFLPNSSNLQSKIIFQRIARELNEPEDVVTRIGLAVIKAYSSSNELSKKTGRNRTRWEEVDLKLLPTVKECTQKLYGQGDERPKKVTIMAVCRALNLPDKRFDYLPTCKAEIMRWHETQEHYWAREVLWAYNRLKNGNEIINWKKIRTLTNIRKNNLEACLKDLEQIADKDTYIFISELL